MFKIAAEVFFIFLRLGLTSFGGPIAHLGYFHHEFVKQKKWIDEHSYADLVALCQFLPGPASSQVGIAIGLSRAGYLGALAAWLGFTLPSAVLLVLFGLGVSRFQVHDAWLHGLKIAAVAIVAQAIWIMGRKLCPDRPRLSLAIAAAFTASLWTNTMAQVAVLILGALAGLLWLRGSEVIPPTPLKIGVTKKAAAFFLFLFLSLLFFLPLGAAQNDNSILKLFDRFFRAGSLVFGGGHVVLPLLRAEVVSSGWVSDNLFMAGYGAAQAIPGPLFAFTAYLGSVLNGSPSGWLGAAICLVAAFLPSFLLVLGVFPYWEQFRRYPKMRKAMQGVNAAVVGLLLAAFYNPVWTSAIHDPKDFALALAAFLGLVFWQLPSWSIVLVSALVGRIFL